MARTDGGDGGDGPPPYHAKQMSGSLLGLLAMVCGSLALWVILHIYGGWEPSDIIVLTFHCLLVAVILALFLWYRLRAK